MTKAQLLIETEVLNTEVQALKNRIGVLEDQIERTDETFEVEYKTPLIDAKSLLEKNVERFINRFLARSSLSEKGRHAMLLFRLDAFINYLVKKTRELTEYLITYQVNEIFEKEQFRVFINRTDDGTEYVDFEKISKK